MGRKKRIDIKILPLVNILAIAFFGKAALDERELQKQEEAFQSAAAAIEQEYKTRIEQAERELEEVIKEKEELSVYAAELTEELEEAAKEKEELLTYTAELTKELEEAAKEKEELLTHAAELTEELEEAAKEREELLTYTAELTKELEGLKGEKGQKISQEFFIRIEGDKIFYNNRIISSPKELVWEIQQKTAGRTDAVVILDDRMAIEHTIKSVTYALENAGIRWK